MYALSFEAVHVAEQDEHMHQGKQRSYHELVDAVIAGIIGQSPSLLEVAACGT